MNNDARWIKTTKNGIICENCGEHPLYDYFGRQCLSPYCPRCGAIMFNPNLPMRERRIQIECMKCENFDAEKNGCLFYGNDSEKAIASCIADNFIVYRPNCGANMEKGNE